MSKFCIKHIRVAKSTGKCSLCGGDIAEGECYFFGHVESEHCSPFFRCSHIGCALLFNDWAKESDEYVEQCESAYAARNSAVDRVVNGRS